jgi:GTP 3',8-cyclase
MKRVFILSSHPLFGRCIETLLSQQDRVRIVGHVRQIDLAIEQIRSLRPDVVIVDSNEPEANRGLIMMQIMEEGLKTCVVGLNLRDNMALICHGEQRTIKALDDFVGMITTPGDVPPNLPRDEITPQPVVLRDRFGRALDQLRVSVTDRCNLCCVHCMPPGGVRSKPRQAILHSEEIARMVEAAASVGLRTIRLTGGEPLVRKGIVGLVRRVAGIPGVDQVSLATNATLLGASARELAGAGLTRVNIRLDSLRPDRYRAITRMGELDSVWQGIAAAEAAGLSPLKINVVIRRGVNDDELADFARLTLDHPWHVRFIEVMPPAGDSARAIDPLGNDPCRVTVAEMQQQLQGWGPLQPDDGPGDYGPTQSYRLQNAAGTIGFISPESNHSCARCRQLRLTADGYLRPCLFADQGVYCKPALDDGATLDELRALISQAADLKPEQGSPWRQAAPSGMALPALGG